MKVKRVTPAQQARIARLDEAKAAAEEQYPNAEEIIPSFFGTELVLDLKDKHGDWHRLAHHTDDITAALGRGA